MSAYTAGYDYLFERFEVVDTKEKPFGASVLTLETKKEAEFYASLMNIVYDRVMNDVGEMTK